MALNDHKLPNFSFRHSDQPDRPNMTVTQFKTALDSQGEELRVGLNSLIDELVHGAFTYIREFGAKGDGIVDDTAAIQSAINQSPEYSTIVFETNKTYFFTSLTCTKSLNFNFNGAKLLVDPSTNGLLGSPAIWFKGAVGNSFSLNTCTQYSATVQLSNIADASNFAVGDYVVIIDNKVVPAWNFGQPDQGSGYKDRSEITMIRAISGDTITLDKPIEWAYDTTPKIQKVTKTLFQPQIFGASYIAEKDPGSNYSGTLVGSSPHIFHFQYCIEPKVENCVFEKWQLHCVNFHYCIAPTVADCSARDPYRPSFGGHGYFMRFDHCLGGVARNNFTRGVRHTVDYTQSYDGHSENNYALNPYDVCYYMHGLGSKRCSSAYDHAIGGDNCRGWAMGNPAFDADYDFTIINPTYVGKISGPAIHCQTNSVGMRVISPDIQTDERGILVTTGASQVHIKGGKIKSIGTGTATEGVMVRAKLANTDTYGITPRDVTIEDVEFYDRTFVSVESDGMVCIGNNKFMTTNTSTATIINIGANVAPQDLFIVDNKILGTYQRGIQINVEPTRSYMVARNFTDGGHTVLAMSLFASILLRQFENQVLNGGFSYTGDIVAAKTGGAVLFGNSPNTNDDTAIKTTALTAKNATVVDSAGSARQITFATGTLSSNTARWIVRANNASETGADTGSDFEISARNDSGGVIGSPMTITRKTGQVKFIYGITEVAGTWDKPFKMNGGNYLWVDSTGKLRIKTASAPTTDTDGVTVGSQA